MWYIRRIMSISWTDRKSNEKVMEMDGYKRSLLKTIRKRQIQFFGHINRADGLGEQIEWKDLWYQKQRKTTHKYSDSLHNFVTRKESPNMGSSGELTTEGWKAMIADVCNRPGT